MPGAGLTRYSAFSDCAASILWCRSRVGAPVLSGLDIGISGLLDIVLGLDLGGIGLVVPMLSRAHACLRVCMSALAVLASSVLSGFRALGPFGFEARGLGVR